jgi:fumarate reductase subunit D
MADAAEGRFEIGRVMSDAARIVTGTWRVTAPIALLFTVLPAALLGLIGYANRHDPLSADAINRLGNIVTGFLGLVVSIVAIHSGINHLNGKTVTISDALQKSSRTFLAIWGVSILTGLGMVIGLILLVVPGIFLALAWSAAVPIRVMEKIDATDAISRSFRLTKNHRWAIFGAGAVLIGFYLGLLLILMGLAFVLGLVGLTVAIDVVVTPVFTGCIVVGQAVFQTAVYYELIRIKEGGGSTVADVFV